MWLVFKKMTDFFGVRNENGQRKTKPNFFLKRGNSEESLLFRKR